MILSYIVLVGKMGRKRRRTVIKTYVRKIPSSYFGCPVCGNSTVMVKINKPKLTGEAICGSCDISWKTSNLKTYEEKIDVYNHFVDSQLGSE